MKRTVVLFAAAMILLPMQAQSTDQGRWEIRRVGYHADGRPHYARVYCRSDGRCYRPRRHAAAARRDATRVYSYEQREVAEQGHNCRDIKRAVGDQHLSVDGAKKAANDSWAGTVRFHLGEKFMDLNNAKHIVYTCSRSSIKEGGVTTLGQSLTRCEIEAQPCHPAREVEASSKER